MTPQPAPTPAPTVTPAPTATPAHTATPRVDPDGYHRSTKPYTHAGSNSDTHAHSDACARPNRQVNAGRNSHTGSGPDARHTDAEDRGEPSGARE